MRNRIETQIILWISFFMLIPLNLSAQKAFIPEQNLKNNTGNSARFEKAVFSNLGLIPNHEEVIDKKYSSQYFKHSPITGDFSGHRGIVSDPMPLAANNLEMSTDRLDSVTFNTISITGVINYKETFMYDENPKRITLILQQWYAPANNWANIERYTYTYDGSSHLIAFLYKKWDTNLGIWTNIKRETYTYDGSGNVLMVLKEKWDTNASVWVNDHRYTYTYDGSGNRLTNLLEEWDANARVWLNRYLITHIYNGSGDMLVELHEDWDATAAKWVNDYGYACIYDSAGNRLAQLETRWDPIAGIWENASLSIHSYDDRGNRLTDLYGIWDKIAQIWINRYNFTYTYDINNNMLTESYRKWDTNTKIWINKYLFTYTYDSSGNRLTNLSEVWDTTIGIWINKYLFTYTYDSSGNLLHFLSQTWSNSTWNAVNGKCLIKNNDFAQVYYASELFAYYSPTTSVNNSTGNTIYDFSLSQNFPNPFNPTTSISYSVSERTHVKIAVFNSLGQLVSILVDDVRLPGKYDVKFDGSNLASGIYSYKIMTDKSAETKRMILVR